MPARLLALVVVLASLALAVAAPAQADLYFWDNYGGDPDSVGYTTSDGSAGGALNSSGVTVTGPEGMAIDTVTGRLYVASYNAGPGEEGQIQYINLDGSGGGVFTAPGAPVGEPMGVAVDPVGRMIYWTNTDGESISWARLDGSAGGSMNLTGAPVGQMYKIAIDPVNGKLYWFVQKESDNFIAYANLNNSGGGGTLDLTGAPALLGTRALAVDTVGGRVYWSDGTSKLFGFASVVGGGGGSVNLGGAYYTNSYGFAVDPTAGRLYWPNYDSTTSRANGIGFASLTGGPGGNLTPPETSPWAGAQDLLVLKAPTGTVAPAITRAKNNRSQLACSAGSWAADFAGSYVYQAPTTTAYRWLRNGKAVAGATATKLTAKSPGKYVCQVTGANQAGSTATSSKVAKVEASKAKLTTKKKVTVKAGGTATFAIKVNNLGDLKSKNAKLCALLPKAAKGFLKPSKCKSLGRLKGKGKKSAKLKITALPAASGVYSVSFKLKGVAGKPAKAKIVVR